MTTNTHSIRNVAVTARWDTALDIESQLPAQEEILGVQRLGGPQQVIGFFTVAPLWVTWLVVDFVFSLLARTGSPDACAAWHGACAPCPKRLADSLLNPFAQYVLAALMTLALLYGVGLLTALVLGRRLIAFMERQLERVPSGAVHLWRHEALSERPAEAPGFDPAGRADRLPLARV